MDKVASLDRKTRADLFRETGARIGHLSPVVIEKDFWVCWLLPRYSRHYADVAEMSQHDVKHQALQDLDLLHQVCLHKDRFYHCGWAHYLDAVPGSFHLVPLTERIPALRRDYQAMQVMFYDQAPDFDAILQILRHLEQEINGVN